MERVSGIGGIFFRARDPERLGAWYAEQLGVELSDWGGTSSGRLRATSPSGRLSAPTPTTSAQASSS